MKPGPETRGFLNYARYGDRARDPFGYISCPPKWGIRPSSCGSDCAGDLSNLVS